MKSKGIKRTIVKNTYAEIPYKCYCGTLTRQYVWSDDINKTKLKCGLCGSKLTYANIIHEVKPEAAAIRTPTKNR